MLRRSRPLCALLGLAVAFSACRDRPPTVPPPGDRLFGRYLSLGNSLTAGYESDGINDSTQAHTYGVRLAASFDAPYNVPLLRRPGCPPPLVGPIPLTADRVGGADPASCAGFVTPIRQPVQNLSFPGFRIAEALTVPTGVAGLVYRQAFGNRSLVQVMIDANPTLVSVWLGNNDALSAMTSGDIAQLTPLAEFEASLATIVSAVAGRPNLRDGLLIGVADPLFSPFVQPGAYFWLVAQDAEGAALLGKPVSDNCAPRAPPEPPNPQAANLVSFRVLADPAVTEISCADDAPYVLNPAEQSAISARVEAFNQALRQSAAANGWIYVDANDEIVTPRLVDPDLVRKCQGLLAATTPDGLRSALEQTCPHPTAPNFFGADISFDGIHPSRQGQQVIAEVLRAALVQKHGPDL